MPANRGIRQVATTKRDLVERVSAKHSALTKVEVGAVVQTFLDEVVQALARGERIELRDFGVFTPRARAARKARNPKTGAVVEVPATRTVAFKLGKEFKAKLAPAGSPPPSHETPASS
jgi:integration host factor subunit beta